MRIDEGLETGFIGQLHKDALDRAAGFLESKPEPGVPAILSYQTPSASIETSLHNQDFGRTCGDYLQLARLSEDLYSAAVCISSDSPFRNVSKIRNVMGFFVGGSFDAITPAGDISASPRNGEAFLFSYPYDETGIFETRAFSEQKTVCIYFERDRVENALGMSIAQCPSSFRQFYEDSQYSCQYMPLPLSFSASAVVQDLLDSPTEGALRYRQISSAANYLLLQFLQTLADIDKSKDPYTDRLEQAKSLLVSDLSARYTLDTIAKKVGIGKTKLAMEFRRKFGVTATEMRREARLTEAFRLLKQTGKPIAIVAEDTGFKNQNYFSDAFKSRFGLSPRDARKKG
ncbi:helix-turn-helix transcriptional regulator [Pseudomaricurvus alkylphenolicus]|uniref:helix-turn-helix domain-containing protein n=1 Tax=Pseudomaricurvus alkylphenolicus TaxID=1306991 RepID=UPI00141EC8AC|nr:AraC family transcriptional regulator [Pseudomaricurvus alkylphenolicus]NIB38154.1 helix-turn-helix transcriptional regulator [Pseudomaricurvus alkylphenolicus]